MTQIQLHASDQVPALYSISNTFEAVNFDRYMLKSDKYFNHEEIIAAE